MGPGGARTWRRQWADTRVPRYRTVSGKNSPLFLTHRPTYEEWNRRRHGGTGAGQEWRRGGTVRGCPGNLPPGVRDAEWERIKGDPVWMEERDWGCSEQDVDDRWMGAAGAADSSSEARREGEMKSGTGGRWGSRHGG